jgi:hypothetical protein
LNIYQARRSRVGSARARDRFAGRFKQAEKVASTVEGLA